MKNKSQISDFIHNLTNKVQSLDKTIIGQKMEDSKMRLSKNNRDAWVDHLVDQYLKKESLDNAPEEFNITVKDIMNKLAQREIMKIFGNK